jgi:hypothetical protein
MVYALWDWVDRCVRDYSGISDGTLAILELQLAIPLGIGSTLQRYRALEEAVRRDDETFLDVTDFLLHELDGRGPDDSQRVALLANILVLAGSVWQVTSADGAFRLGRSLDPVVQAAVAETIASGDRASHLLSAAWGHAYGRSPNASAAYRDAVRAVEAIAKPVILPRDGDATLGKMIPAMKDKPEKWEVVLTPPKGDPVLAIVGMMELLWKSQLDRHGTDDETVPINVGPDEAQAAVHLAAALVHLFRSGAVRAS